MNCIKCPLYRFDGKKFSCPGIPYHDFGNEGMFADPRQPLYKNKMCIYARIRLAAVEHELYITNEKLKKVYDDIAICKLVLNIVTPKSESWYEEFKNRLREAESTAGGLECLKEKLEKEKSTIVPPLEN